MAKQKLVKITVGKVAIHVRGQVVPAGETAEVTEDQAAFLKKVGALAPEKAAPKKKGEETQADE